MRKRSKILMLSIGLILVMALTFGCTEDSKDPDDNTGKVESPMTLSAGFLNEKYIENETMTIELGYVKGDNEAYGGNLILKVKDESLFDELNNLQHYIVSYDEDYNVVSIESNPVVEEFILAGQQSESEKEVVVIEPSEDLDTNNLTLLDSYSIDIYGDEEDEKISMYTTAEKDPEGNIMWDDGQNWTIAIEGKERDFIIFDDYLQLASLEFFVYTIDEDFYISTVNSGTANLTLTDYKYDKENNTFEKKIKSNTSGNVNMIYKSISSF